MTSIQLAAKLARHMQERDLTRMPIHVLSEVLDAVNAALQITYAALPRLQRQTTVSETLAAPATIAVDVVETGGVVLLGAPFAQGQFGCTVRLPGDSHDNEIVSGNSVLDEYLGTTLSGNATVYGDCIPLYQVIEEVVSAVRVYGEGCRGELTRSQARRDRTSLRQIGTPTTWALEAVGSSQNGDPEFYLRVHPMPDRALRVRFEALLSSFRVTLPQLTRDAVVLPIAEALCESCLVPIGEEHLLKSPYFANDRGVPHILKQAERARRMLDRQSPDMAPLQATVGTPPGF